MEDSEIPDQAESHMEDDDPGIDPELAASMGFSSFGNASKKRKYNPNDAVVDVPNGRQHPRQAQGAASGRGANALPLGSRSTTSKAGGSPAGHSQRLPVHDAASATNAPVSNEDGISVKKSTSETQGASQPPDLASYRHGVRQADGTMTYFLPSFLEDPWAKLLEPQG